MIEAAYDVPVWEIYAIQKNRHNEVGTLLLFWMIITVEKHDYGHPEQLY